MKRLYIEDGETIYMEACLSLNNLRERRVSAEDVINSKFALKITQKSHDFDYGTHNYYQIEVMKDGHSKDIDIEGIKISYLIDYKYTKYTTYNQYYHIFTFHGLNKNNQPFDVSLEAIYGSTHIHSIVFAIIFISEFNNVSDLKEIWSFLFDSNFVEIGKSITLLNRAIELSKKLIEKYPMIEHLLQNQINARVEIIKKELEKLTILK